MRLANQVRYAGTLPACAAGPDGNTQASLVRVADRFSFAPQDGVLVVSGDIGPDGSFAGTLTPAAGRRDGAGDAPFTLSVTGRLDEEEAAGTYVTPRCRAEFRLPRVRPSLLP